MMLVATDSKKTEELVRTLDVTITKLVRALDVTITKYRSHHKVVHIVSTDHESILKSEQLALHLNGKGVKVALRIPYEHEKSAERSMRKWRPRFLSYLTTYPLMSKTILHRM